MSLSSLQKPAVKSTTSFFRSPIFDVLQFAVLIVLLGYLLLRSGATIGYSWQWYRVPQYFYTVTEAGIIAGPLTLGLLITLKISAISLFFAFLIGLITAMLRLSNSFAARWLAIAYLELSRNTPLLIQIFFIYFVLGPTLGLDRFPSAILALSLFEGAYTSEIFRSGIQSVPKGQVEAAKSIGLSTLMTYRHIIIPQAIRTVLPPLTSQAISLVKDSALVSTIAIYDLTMQAQNVISETYLTFEIWFAVAGVYLVLNLFLSLLVGFTEKRLRLP
jgi:polar amino acid transport system permease protein